MSCILDLLKIYTDFHKSDTAAKVPQLEEFLSNIRALNKAGASPPVAGTFVVYDLPDRDCAALASNGEYAIADNGVAKYEAYIDSIRAHLVTYSDVKVILLIGLSRIIPVIYHGADYRCRTRFVGQLGDQHGRY